jgi:hypothetical protein
VTMMRPSQEAAWRCKFLDPTEWPFIYLFICLFVLCDFFVLLTSPFLIYRSQRTVGVYILQRRRGHNIYSD